MSTVKIHPKDGGGYSVILEGHDISHLVAANGIEVSFDQRLNRRLCQDEMWTASPTVRITLAAGLDTDVEFPDALVETFQPNKVKTLSAAVEELDATVQALKSAITTGVRAGVKKGIKP